MIVKKGVYMQTVQLQLNDDLYNNLSAQNVDIQTKVKEYLFSLVDDGYKSISEDEAKKRVSEAVDRYQNKTSQYRPIDENYIEDINQYVESL